MRDFELNGKKHQPGLLDLRWHDDRPEERQSNLEFRILVPHPITAAIIDGDLTKVLEHDCVNKNQLYGPDDLSGGQARLKCIIFNAPNNLQKEDLMAAIRQVVGVEPRFLEPNRNPPRTDVKS